MPPHKFRVRSTEDVLLEKKDNLFRKLQQDHGVDQSKINELDRMLLDKANGKTLTQFCSMHLGGIDRDEKKFRALAEVFVGKLGNVKDRDKAIHLCETYLHMFQSFIC